VDAPGEITIRIGSAMDAVAGAASPVSEAGRGVMVGMDRKSLD